ncbi:MAG: hypothetical protein IPO86_06565 [Saprospiraceae bacterium]|nr:hypothetical protein [Saprospiraceae bacterium]MBK9727766.1 hypothetical protein [Saprospiraceae bacterium]
MRINLFVFMSCIILWNLNLGCKSKMGEQDRPVMEKVDTSGIEYSSMYICPMHCKGSGSDKPGICPVCGMDYELNENIHQHPAQDSVH